MRRSSLLGRNPFRSTCTFSNISCFLGWKTEARFHQPRREPMVKMLRTPGAKGLKSSRTCPSNQEVEMVYIANSNVLKMVTPVGRYQQSSDFRGHATTCTSTWRTVIFVRASPPTRPSISRNQYIPVNPQRVMSNHVTCSRPPPPAWRPPFLPWRLRSLFSRARTF